MKESTSHKPPRLFGALTAASTTVTPRSYPEHKWHRYNCHDVSTAMVGQMPLKPRIKFSQINENKYGDEPE